MKNYKTVATFTTQPTEDELEKVYANNPDYFPPSVRVAHHPWKRDQPFQVEMIPNPEEWEKGILQISEDNWSMLHIPTKVTLTPPWVFSIQYGKSYTGSYCITSGPIDTRVSGWKNHLVSVNFLTKTAMLENGDEISLDQAIEKVKKFVSDSEKIKKFKSDSPEFKDDLNTFNRALENIDKEYQVPYQTLFYM
jgi:hypothetical protein